MARRKKKKKVGIEVVPKSKSKPITPNVYKGYGLGKPLKKKKVSISI